VRYRHRGGMRNAFFEHTDTTIAARTIVRLGISSDVYVGVAPRRTRRGAKHAITEIWALWADLDDVDAHQALEQLPVAPAILIASGIIRSGLAQARCASGGVRRRHVVSEADRMARGGIRDGR